MPPRRLLHALLCLLGLFIAAPLAAEVARVSGGEHEDFTRLVVEAKGIGDWRLGRAVDGYELQLGNDVSSFDVTQAFEKIPRDRITALWRDPASGRLRFSLSCACHAVAFEFRPGIVVIDIRNGPPPDGSAFEVPLDPPAPPTESSTASTDTDATAATPAAAGFNWVELSREAAAEDLVLTMPLPLPTGEVSLDPLRDALLSQISKGAAEGVVDIVEGDLPKSKAGEDTTEGPWSRISVGELPGLKSGKDRNKRGTLTADGRNCLPDDQLNVASWGQSGPVASQLGLARSGMLAEFDAAVPAAVLRSARFHIFVGFGAEARQYLQFLAADQAGDADILRAMAHLVDEEPLDDDPFYGMESCDGAAALWSTLARRTDGMPPPDTNVEAVARSFSALPPHLRRHLGGALVDMFLASGEEETARKLRDSIMRLPVEGDPDVELMDARYQLAKGDDEAATDLAEGVLAESGPASVEAAITLVEAAFKGDHSVDPGLSTAIDAFLLGARGTGTEAALIRAKVLAAAMEGDYSAAFGESAATPATLADLWSMAAAGAPDDVFLEQAAAQASQPSEIHSDVALAVAQRLMALGFPDLSLGWLAPVDAQSAEDLRLLSATAHLAMRDAAAAIGLLEGMIGAEAETIRAAATLQLGDVLAASDALVRAGDQTGGERTIVWSRDWSLIKDNGPDAWKAAAGLVGGSSEVPAEGPIARGAALIEESAAARATLDALLGSVTQPPATQ